MTEDVEVMSARRKNGATTTSVKSDVAIIVTSKAEILESLSHNNKIYFKSQQIDDPELTDDEKYSIAEEVLNKSLKNFLIRFGKFLEEHHLKYFAENSSTTDEEIQYLIDDLQKQIQQRPHDVKNRRFAALKTMIKDDNYFNEKEMMKREPYLYEQLIGQYLTDTEKRIRDQHDMEETPFSKILLDNFDRDQMEELRKQQERDDVSDNISECSTESLQNSDASSNDELYPKIPQSYRKQWGNFEDEEVDSNIPAAAIIPRKEKRQKPQKYITAGEREMLRQEFLGIMYTKFLDGDDKEFDYTQIDNDTELDDLEQIGQDNEDKYFDEDDDDDDGIIDIGNERMDDQSSEDELDLYMKHLSRDESLQDF